MKRWPLSSAMPRATSKPSRSTSVQGSDSQSSSGSGGWTSRCAYASTVGASSPVEARTSPTTSGRPPRSWISTVPPAARDSIGDPLGRTADVVGVHGIGADRRDRDQLGELGDQLLVGRDHARDRSGVPPTGTRTTLVVHQTESRRAATGRVVRAVRQVDGRRSGERRRPRAARLADAAAFRVVPGAAEEVEQLAAPAPAPFPPRSEASQRTSHATSRTLAASASARSFFRLWCSIWRIRSRVTLNARPTSSSVRGCWPSRP